MRDSRLGEEMNLLEHYIIRVIRIEDVTEEFNEYLKKLEESKSPERLYVAKLEVDCYGKKEIIERGFFESELKRALEQGYYLA
jgi:hypothetical protein